MPQELLNYIKTTQGQGYTLDQIKAQLLRAGWSLFAIDEAISSSNKAEAVAAQNAPTTSMLRERILCIIFCLLAVVLAILVNNHYFI